MRITELQAWAERDPVWRAPLWARVALATSAVSLFGFRFQDTDLVTYVLDEPQIQDAAQADAQAGQWARISVVRGTQGTRYGPAPLWFYTAVKRLVGPLPERSILSTTLLLTGAQLAMAVAAARALGGGALLFSALAALLASSPFLFYWSRTGWDNPLLGAFVALAVAALVCFRLRPLLRGTVLGLLVGLGLSTHLMAIPFSLAVLFVLLLGGRRSRSAFLAAGTLVATTLVVVLPYIEALRTEPPTPAPAWQHWGGPAEVVGRLRVAALEPARVLTAARLDYFLDGAAADFRAALGAWHLVLDAGPLLSWFLALLAAAGLLFFARTGKGQTRSLAVLGLFVWVGHAFFLGLPALRIEPHYQQPTSWVVATGCCALVMALLPRRPRAAWLLLGGLWLLALAQVGFTEAWMRWVRENGGTAGIHYSVPMGAQRALLRAICSGGGSQVALNSQTYLFPESLLSLARTEPACVGKHLLVCPGRCPPLDTRWSQAVVRYAAYPGGRLALYIPP